MIWKQAGFAVRERLHAYTHTKTSPMPNVKQGRMRMSQVRKFRTWAGTIGGIFPDLLCTETGTGVTCGHVRSRWSHSRALIPLKAETGTQRFWLGARQSSRFLGGHSPNVCVCVP
jgi:hypothetical protein